jgi:quercetin dioxygenase-like cupin family protein
MARSGGALEHPVTRERIVWRKVARETGGEVLELDLYMAPGGFVAAEHIHSKQEERFEVIAGTVTLRLDGVEATLHPGETAVVSAGQPHVWWNSGSEEAQVRGQVIPALRTEIFFETFFGLGADAKTNSKGLPNPLQLAVLMREYKDELRLARPPYVVQALLFVPLALLGRLVGYRGWYQRYSPDPVQWPFEPRRAI